MFCRVTTKKSFMLKFPKKHNKKAQATSSGAVVGLLIVIILVVISINIADQLIDDTTQLIGTNQDLVYTAAPAAQSFQLDLSGLTLVTSSVAVNESTLINVSDTGLLFFNSSTNHTVVASYNLEPVGFTTGLSSTVIGFVPVFLALIALFAAAAFIMLK